MSKALRWSEKWFNRGLWLLALVFASFLIGLGGAIVGDLPRVAEARSLDDFLDPQRAPALQQRIERDRVLARDAQAALEQAQLRLQTAQANHRAARDNFNQWLATRQATQRPDQDPALIERTRELEAFRLAERTALSAVEAQQQVALDARQSQEAAQRELDGLRASAQQAFDSARRTQELRVFGYRLALTLPLLALAAWLFVKHRRGTWWPFVWGFVFFALFAFFVELVPYLPSYGGYVRQTVGIVLTVLAGRYAIRALQRYRERQAQAEALPDVQRRQELDYDVAQARLTKGVCPGCERTVDLKDGQTDFCPHCGLCLFARCGHCATRKSAFARYCFACGTATAAPAPPAG